ncbi:bifunctional DNA primase/polymerase [Methylobacterium nigriterrae]|uniref:bifunctional DNA primase/polymerase n=1 Tax=Methylobacterium nigriterrae TaxID=3127512 RepID=UPI0030137904
MLEEDTPNASSGQASSRDGASPRLSASGVPGLTPTQVRLKICQNGFSNISIHTHLNADPKKAGKAPNELDWQRKAAFGAPLTTPEEVIARKPTETRAPSTGILCGNHVGIDLDFLVHADVAEEAYAMAFRHFGVTPFVRQGQAPKVLLVYRAAEPIVSTGRKAADGSGDGVDILACGKQFVAFGIHPKTRQLYRWIGPKNPLTASPDAAPEITQKQVDAFLFELSRLIELNKGGSRKKGKAGGSPQVTRDPVSGLIIDGREGYLATVIWRSACQIVDEGEELTVANLSDRAWAAFAQSADLKDGKWTRASAETKAAELIGRLQRGNKTIKPAPKTVEPSYADNRRSLEEAEAAVEQVIGTFFREHVPAFKQLREAHKAALTLAAETGEEPPEVPVPTSWGARIETAVGKTERAIVDAVGAAQANITVVLTVPDHRLSNELANRIRSKTGAEARVYYGYERPDPELPGQAMCLNLEAFRDARDAGVSKIAGAICERRVEGNLILQCTLIEKCGMQRQRAAKPLIWIVPHALLYRQRPSYIPEPDAIVIDEGFVLGALPDQPAIFTLDAMEACDFTVQAGGIELILDSNDLEVARASFMRALRAHEGDGPLRREILLRHRVTAALAASAYRLEWKRALDPGIAPGMEPDGRKKRAAKVGWHNAQVKQWAAIWAEVDAFLSGDAEKSGRLSLRFDTRAGVRQLERRSLSIIRSSWSAPTLCLDATLPETPLLEAVIGHRVEMQADISVRWSPHGIVRQIVRAPVSSSKLGLVPDHSRQADPTVVGDLLRLIRLRAALVGPDRDVLVIGPMRLTEKFEAAGLPENVSCGHFNAIAGQDRWRNAASLICIGRPLPGPREVEGNAGAITGRAPEAIEDNERGQ